MRGCALTIGVIIIILLGLVLVANLTQQQPDPHQTAIAVNLIREAIKNAKLEHSGTFTTGDTKPNHYIVTLYYRPGTYVSQETAHADMEMIARAILSKLIAAGHKPSNEDTFIYISAEQPTYGETGKALAFDLGHVIYDYARDQLEYSPP